MGEQLKQFYSTSKGYLERLNRHDESSYAQYIELCKTEIPSGGSILECGCGVGLSSYLLAKEGFKVTAIDISPLFISEAKKKYGNHPNLRFLVGDVENMSFADQSFDGVCSILFLEHVTDVKGTLKEMGRILRNGGLLITSMPNFLDPVQHLIACIRWKTKDKYKPWEAKTRIGAFYQFMRIIFLRIVKAFCLNRKIYPLQPVLSNEKEVCGQDFDTTWLANLYDVKNILNELGFSIQCIFPDNSGGKAIQIMRILRLPKVLQSAYKEMRASGFVVVGKKK